MLCYVFITAKFVIIFSCSYKREGAAGVMRMINEILERTIGLSEFQKGQFLEP